MRENYLIVDGHVHTFSTYEIATKIMQSFNKIYSIEFENPSTGVFEEVLSNMDKIGIDYTIMANFASVRILHSNNMWTLQLSKQNKSLVPLVSFHPEMDRSITDLFSLYIKEGARGVKIHPMAQGFDISNKGMEELYVCCRELRFPIVLHCGRIANARTNEYADLNMLLPVINKYPEIPFVLTHMVDGNVEDVMYMAENYENVFFDTSIIITGYPPLIETNEPSWPDDNAVVDIINKVGAHRVLFGSDFPWGSPAHDVPRLLGMKLSDEQKRLILGENAMKLFKI